MKKGHALPNRSIIRIVCGHLFKLLWRNAFQGDDNSALSFIQIGRQVLEGSGVFTADDGLGLSLVDGQSLLTSEGQLIQSDENRISSGDNVPQYSVKTVKLDR
jgi:hypothetical protein